ncbi:MAG: TIGR04282 family arsenosugar biosynthesis glycosyltransferase [Gammaproteobacteria bacterium]|jgi:rSAM/selenodomain-associated transferase 1
MKYPDSRLLVFSKAPDPGRVKTRLIPVLGREGSASLYSALLQDCLQRCTTAGLCPVELWCSPSVEHPFFQQCGKRFGVALRQQCGGDLGRRMAHALDATGTGTEAAVLIGADCPAMETEDIEAAFTALVQGTPVVLGPATDGGYYLVGMRDLQRCIFEDMPWSTPAVLDITRSRLQRRGIAWHCLPVRRDLDTPADYASYVSQAAAIRHSTER